MQVRVLSGQRNERERERGDGKRQARPLPSFLPSFLPKNNESPSPNNEQGGKNDDEARVAMAVVAVGGGGVSGRAVTVVVLCGLSRCSLF